VVCRADGALAGARHHYLSRLGDSVVRSRKTPVGRQRLHGGILQVTLNDVP
jgi:hypothetical protein